MFCRSLRPLRLRGSSLRCARVGGAAVDVVFQRRDDEAVCRSRQVQFLAHLHHAAREPGQLQPISALQVPEHGSDHPARQSVDALQELVYQIAIQLHTLGFAHCHHLGHDLCRQRSRVRILSHRT